MHAPRQLQWREAVEGAGSTARDDCSKREVGDREPERSRLPVEISLLGKHYLDRLETEDHGVHRRLTVCRNVGARRCGGATRSEGAKPHEW